MLTERVTNFIAIFFTACGLYCSVGLTAEIVIARLLVRCPFYCVVVSLEKALKCNFLACFFAWCGRQAHTSIPTSHGLYGKRINKKNKGHGTAGNSSIAFIY